MERNSVVSIVKYDFLCVYHLLRYCFVADVKRYSLCCLAGALHVLKYHVIYNLINKYRLLARLCPTVSSGCYTITVFINVLYA